MEINSTHNEITLSGKITVCENSDGQMVISPAKGSGVTLALTEHGTVIAKPQPEAEAA